MCNKSSRIYLLDIFVEISNIPTYILQLNNQDQICKLINRLAAMLNKIRMLFRNKQPQFRHFQLQIPKGLSYQLQNKVFWTPRIQKIKYSEDLHKYIKFLQRSRVVNYTHMRELVQHILTEYHHLMKIDRPHQNITLQKNVYIPPNVACSYHGKVDWLYSANGFNMTPVLFFPIYTDQYAGAAAALSNMHIRKNLKQKMQEQLKKGDKKFNHTNSYGENNLFGYCLMTTGHMWQMIRVDCNYYLEKSIIIEANNQYRSIHHDEQLIQVVLGMIDYCLDLPSINVKALQKSYQYIAERRWMSQTDDVSQIEGASPISKALLNHYKKKF